MARKQSRASPPLSLRARLDRLRRYGKREAYLWKEGVRWRSRTYATLHRRILACAALLSGSGVEPGDPVLLQGPEHPDWVEGLLGIWRAGGVAIPLERGTTQAFREEVARRVGGRLLLAPPDVEPPAGCRRLDLGSWGEDGPSPGGLPEVDPGPGERAEVVFTSGTTGQPKGVILTHGNLASDFAPLERAYLERELLVRPLGRLRFLSTLPLSHMFGQAMDVFISLFMGFTVVFVPPRPHEILETAPLKRAWGLFTVPRLLELLGAEVGRLLRDQGRLEGLERRAQRFERWPFYLQAPLFWRVQRLFGWRFRLIVVGGAGLPEAVQRFWERFGYLVVQGYGLTETAPVVSASNPFERRAGSVGRPLESQEVRIGPGGEVLVRGPNVTPGYLGTGPESRAEEWLRTGDVGEIDAEGRLRIRGRLKDMIVTPEGENVYPTDVEVAFDGIPGVREASVIGLPYEGGERVHAVLLLEKGADPEEAVRRANETLLPKQRVRDHTVWPEEDFPRTAIGKVRKGIVRDRVVALRGETEPREGVPSEDIGSVRRLLAEVARVRPERLKETTRLVEGLGFASLDLVELTVAFEEEFGVSLAEDRLAELTVGDLERVVRESRHVIAPGGIEAPGETEGRAAGVERGRIAGRARPVARGSLRMPRWARSAPARLLRGLVLELVFKPIVLLYVRLEIRGLEHLEEADPPFLIVGNHLSYLDTVVFQGFLPWRLRGRVVPGMTTRYHRVFFGEEPGSPARYAHEAIEALLVQLLFGAWPLPETAGFRASLSYAGELADEGFSLLVFPEGRHVPEGTTEPFRKGIGILARELRAPVIPACLEGTARVLPDGARWLRRGKVRLVIGSPLRIDPGADAAEATRRIEAAVRGLRAVTRPGRGAPG